LRQPLAATGLLFLCLANPAQAAREMTTDRPDTTESPFTVEAGRMQLEVSFFEYSRDRANPQHANLSVEEWNLAPFNLRVGVADNVDLHFIFEPHHRIRIDDRDARHVDSFSGSGDLTLRAKWNFWGNDGGPTALGLMPFVKLPTAASSIGNGRIEGGVILPANFELPAGWGLAVMTEVDFVRNDANTGYDHKWVNTASFDHRITGDLNGFIELVSQVGGPPEASLNGGLTLGIGENLQFDTGVNLGLTRGAQDFLLFTGFAWRR
jgi:hypothetical protein